jgi:formate-dependent nitrite reductase cytochrome c552 subunit
MKNIDYEKLIKSLDKFEKSILKSKKKSKKFLIDIGVIDKNNKILIDNNQIMEEFNAKQAREITKIADNKKELEHILKEIKKRAELGFNTYYVSDMSNLSQKTRNDLYERGFSISDFYYCIYW